MLSSAIESIIQRDPEFNGQINRALHNGHDFSFYLAQLNTQLTERLRIESATDAEKNLAASTPTVTHYYRNPSCSANDKDFQVLTQYSQFLQAQNQASLLLWMCMHPEPLALHNDANRIDSEVIANCELHAQRRQKTEQVNKFEQFAPDLVDLIPASQTALV